MVDSGEIEGGQSTSRGRQRDMEMEPPSTSRVSRQEGGARLVTPSAPRPRLPPPTAEEEEEMEMKYGAEHVIRLFIPVSICMAIVITTLKLNKFYSTPDPNMNLAYTPFQTNDTDGTSTRVFSGLGNALIMICFIVVMTFGLILLYKFKCYRIIHGWLMISSLFLLTAFASLYVSEMIRAFNWVVSSPTLFFCLFNFAAMGMICIHWKGPLMLQQGYLIAISSLMALTFIKLLPDWTAWALLGLISIWDLIAVLCPKGPLNMLVKMSQERNEPIFPALIYSSGILLPYTMVLGVEGEGGGKKKREEKEEEEGGEERESKAGVSQPGPSSTSVLIPSGEGTSKRPQVRRIPPPGREEGRREGGGREGEERGGGEGQRREPRGQSSEEEEEERGIKLGLGDFIFYSVLVGKACASNDWNTIVACYVAILVGLCATLLLLAVFKKALPALPISITAGLIFYFCTTFLITPFTTRIVSHQLTY